LSDVVYFEGEKDGIPVEVALTYNTSYSENIQAYVNNINTYHEMIHGDINSYFSTCKVKVKPVI
jgi:DNA gyrase subunit B